jgi:hypothetical protein
MKVECAECEREIIVDEPQTCFYTGLQRSCGDCRDPKTNRPPVTGGCFGPRLCTDCAEKKAVTS